LDVGRTGVFKPATASESSHGSSNGNGVRVINFVTSKSQFSDIATFINMLGYFQIGRHTD
jgi:hypothetical protein